MTDKIHANWRKQGIPTWESQIPAFTRGFSQIEQDAMQQEIDALRSRCTELESLTQGYLEQMQSDRKQHLDARDKAKKEIDACAKSLPNGGQIRVVKITL